MNAPQVNLSFTAHWCPRHLEPFREEWPKGAAVGMLALFEAAVADEQILAAAPKAADGLANTAALDNVLLEYSPLCCHLGDEVMQTVYERAGVA